MSQILTVYGWMFCSEPMMAVNMLINEVRLNITGQIPHKDTDKETKKQRNHAKTIPCPPTGGGVIMAYM